MARKSDPPGDDFFFDHEGFESDYERRIRAARVAERDRLYRISVLQQRIRYYRENDFPESTIISSLMQLRRLGGLQSWRDSLLLAERALSQGRKNSAREIIEEALGQLKGQPHTNQARHVLETVLEQCQSAKKSRSVQPTSKKDNGKAVPIEKPSKVSSTAPPLPPTPSVNPPKTERSESERPKSATQDDVALELVVEVQSSPTLSQALAVNRDAGLASWRLARLGHQVAVAERFDHLICLESLRGVEHMPHQMDTVRRVLKVLRGRALLADEVGLGKTIEAGMVLSEYLHRCLVESVLILTPASLVGQWREELATKFGIEVASTEDEAFRRDPDEFFTKEPRIVASLEVARSRRHCDRVAQRQYDIVIVDEAHRLKKSSTLGYQLVDRLRSRFLLLLTATPVENRLDELYNIVTLLRPGQLDTLAVFRQRFVAAGDPSTPRDADTLRSLLSEVMIRNTRALVDLRLPPRFASTVKCAPSSLENALYQEITRAVSARYARGSERLALSTLMQAAGSSLRAVKSMASNMLEKAEEAELAAFLRATIDQTSCGDVDPSKAHTLLNLLHTAASAGEKSVVFTRFRETLAFLDELLDTRRIGHVCFSGAMTGPQKDAAVRALSEEVGVLLATEVGGEGRNLQCASTLINYDLPWNPMRLEQRIGRLHRIGQTREVRIYNLCAVGSAEERILEVLDRRINMFELVVGELDMILGELEEEREFSSRVLEIYGTSSSDEELRQGFERLGDEIQAARDRYEQTKSLDRALFSRDYEV